MSIHIELNEFIIDFIKGRLKEYSSKNGDYNNYHLTTDEILKFTYKIQSDYLLASEEEKNTMIKKMPNILDLINKNEFRNSQSIRASILYSASSYLEEFQSKMGVNNLTDLESSDYYKSRMKRGF